MSKKTVASMQHSNAHGEDLGPQLKAVQEQLCKGKTVIGVDIGVSSVNVAQAAVYHGKPTIIKTVVENISVVNEGERDQATIDALRRALAVFNTKKAEIVCVTPNRQTIVKCMRMPVMPENELRAAVKLEVSGSRNFIVEKPVMDFKIIGREIDKGVEKYIVVIAVTAQFAIENLLAKFVLPQARPSASLDKLLPQAYLAGIKVAAIIPVAMALENIIRKSRVRMDETLAIMEMGTIATELNIFSNARFEFSRQIPVTGFDLTRCLTGALFTKNGKIELSVTEAERVKCKYGIPEAGDEFIEDGQITAGQILALLRPRLEQLVGEIRRSFDFYQQGTRAGKIERLIIFGGGAKMKGLSDFLSNELDIPVLVGNPMQNIEVLGDGLLKDQEDAQRLVQAIGAALGSTDGLNLLPESFKARRKTMLRLLAVGIVSAALLCLTVVSYACYYFKVQESRQELVMQSAQYKTLLPKLQGVKDGVDMFKLEKSQPNINGFLKQLSHLPENLFIDDLSIKGAQVHMSVAGVGDQQDIQDAPADFLQEMERVLINPVLGPVKAQPGDGGAIEFTIDGNLRSVEDN